MDLSRLEPVKVQPLNEIVYGRLLDAIVSGKLPPGTEVTIAKLADQLLRGAHNSLHVILSVAKNLFGFTPFFALFVIKAIQTIYCSQ